MDGTSLVEISELRDEFLSAYPTAHEVCKYLRVLLCDVYH